MTVWKKKKSTKRQDAFQESFVLKKKTEKNEEDVLERPPELDRPATNNIDAGRFADELLLMKGKRTSADEVKPYTEQEEEEETLAQQFQDLTKNFNLAKGAKLYKDTVESIPTAFHETLNKAGVNAMVDRHLPDPNSPEAQKAKEIIRNQIVRFLAIQLSYIIVLNWWFLWYYSDFTFDWKSVLNFPLFHIFYYAVEPVCAVLEYINYYLLNMRMDADLSTDIRGYMHKLWDYRPITFTVFYIFMTTTLTASPFGRWIKSVLSGSPTGLYMVMVAASVFMYFYLNINVGRLLMLHAQFGNILVVVFVLLLMLLFVILFAGFFTPFFCMYLGILSHLSIVIFSGTNTFEKIREIFSDLVNAPVKEPESESSFVRLGNFLFQQFHGLAVVWLLVLPMFLYNLWEAGQNIKNPEIVASVLLLNGAFAAFYAYIFSGTIRQFGGIVYDAVKSFLFPKTMEPMKVPEQPIVL
jgi:hypothetical protein